MDEIARIIKIEGTKITVKGGELGGCFGCVNETCRVNGNRFVAENRKGFELSEGQLVEVSSSTSATAAQAIFVFLPPVGLFALAYTALAVLFPTSSDAVRAASGVVGLALGFLIVYGARKTATRVAMPEIVRLVPETEVEASMALGGSGEEAQNE